MAEQNSVLPPMPPLLWDRDYSTTIRTKYNITKAIVERIKQRPALYDEKKTRLIEPEDKRILWEEIAIELFGSTDSVKSKLT